MNSHNIYIYIYKRLENGLTVPSHDKVGGRNYSHEDM